MFNTKNNPERIIHDHFRKLDIIFQCTIVICWFVLPLHPLSYQHPQDCMKWWSSKNMTSDIIARVYDTFYERLVICNTWNCKNDFCIFFISIFCPVLSASWIKPNSSISKSRSSHWKTIRSCHYKSIVPFIAETGSLISPLLGITNPFPKGFSISRRRLRLISLSSFRCWNPSSRIITPTPSLTAPSPARICCCRR